MEGIPKDPKVSKNKGKHNMNRNRRSNIELEDDIKRYQEILQRDQDLVSDIPPKRNLINQEKTEEILKFRLRSANSVKKIPRTSNRKVNLAPNRSKLSRPAYTTIKRKFDNKGNRYKNSKIIPPLISDIIPTSLEDSVILSNSYQELIKIIKNNISQKDDIDIPMHYNLLPKNIKEENLRFSIQGGNDFFELSFVNSSIFQSGDIDFFFESLSENSTSSYKEFLMNNVPLA